MKTLQSRRGLPSLSVAATAFTIVGACSAGSAASVSGFVYSDPADGFTEFRDNGLMQVHPDTDGGFDVNVGEWFGPGITTAILPFQLPDLGAKEDPFLAADLGVHVYQIGNDTVTGVDLYGVRVDPDPSIKVEDHYQGAAFDPTPGVVLIQEDFLTPGGPVGFEAEPNNFTNDAGDAALVDYLNASYAGGANAGSFVFLRMSYGADGFAAGWDAYKFTTSEAQFEGDWPILSFTAVPEPASLLAVACGVAVALTRRR